MNSCIATGLLVNGKSILLCYNLENQSSKALKIQMHYFQISCVLIFITSIFDMIDIRMKTHKLKLREGN